MKLCRLGAIASPADSTGDVLDYPVAAPDVLRPSTSCFVASARLGFASRPKQAIDGTGTFTPLNSQPCRLPLFRSSFCADAP